MKKRSVSVIDVILLVLPLALAFGTKFAFHACAPKADGTWMHCHRAELAVVALGAALTVIALVRLLCAGACKAALSLAAALLAAVTALVPGVLVPLCMMRDMRCHALMRPAVFVLCVLTAAVAAVDALVQLKAARRAGAAAPASADARAE